MASIRKTKKRLKREFRKYLDFVKFSCRLKSFTITGNYNGSKWKTHVILKPRLRIKARIVSYSPIPQSDFLKEVGPIPFERLIKPKKQ